MFGFARMRAVVDELQRSAGRGVASVRSRSRRLRARRGRLDAGARARGSGAGAGRAHLCVCRWLRIDLRRATIACRWIPTAREIMRAHDARVGRSGLRLEAIGYVNFHGTSTQLNDAVEARCVRRFVRRHAWARLAGSSTKSMIGHPQGASGAAGVAATAMAFATGVLPPTINISNQDRGLRSRHHSEHAASRADRSRALQLSGFRIQEQRPRPAARVTHCPFVLMTLAHHG